MDAGYMYSNADPVLWQLPGPIKGGCKGKDQNAKEPKGVTSPKHRGIALRIISLGMTRNVFSGARDQNQENFLVLVVDEDAKRTYPCKRQQGLFARSLEGRFWSEAEVRETCLRAD